MENSWKGCTALIWKKCDKILPSPLFTTEWNRSAVSKSSRESSFTLLLLQSLLGLVSKRNLRHAAFSRNFWNVCCHLLISQLCSSQVYIISTVTSSASVSTSSIANLKSNFLEQKVNIFPVFINWLICFHTECLNLVTTKCLWPLLYIIASYCYAGQEREQFSVFH